MVVDIEHVAISSAAAILHLPHPSSSSSGLKKSGAYTLEELQAASSSDVFQIVAPVALLSFDHRDQVCSAVFDYLYILNFEPEYTSSGSTSFSSTVICAF